MANAVLILVMIPIFNSAIYPALARCNLLKTSLQRIGVGFFCAALAFFVSGFVDLQLEVKLRQFVEPLFSNHIQICFRKHIQHSQRKVMGNFKFTP